MFEKYMGKVIFDIWVINYRNVNRGNGSYITLDFE